MWQSDSVPAQADRYHRDRSGAEPSALAVQYHRSSHVIWAGATALELLVPAALLFTGLSARVRDLARRIARGRWFLTVAIYGAAYVLIQAIVFLPFAWYAGFVRQHAYGLSTETAGAVAGRLGERDRDHGRRRRAGSVDPVPAAARESQEMVALDRAPRRARSPCSR